MHSYPWLLLFSSAVRLTAASSINIPTVQIAPNVQFPVISIGTGGTEHSQSATIVQNWMGLGGRGVDTALIYQDQAVVAKAIADSGVARKDVFITTKIPGCSLAKSSIEEDLKELNTTYIDLLLIHFPRGGDCAEAWSVLESFHASGAVRAIGVSNFNVSQLEPILAKAKIVPAVNQIPLNVLEHDDALIAYCKQHGITVEAYSPLGRDSGKIPANPVIQTVAASHNVSTYQVAMRWIVQHGHTLTFQSTSAEHQKADADVFSFELTHDEMTRLDALQGGITLYS
jgi:2,5-diketo-D-gluconate reductase A